MSHSEACLHSPMGQGDLKGIFHLQSPQRRALDSPLVPDRLGSQEQLPQHRPKVHFLCHLRGGVCVCVCVGGASQTHMQSQDLLMICLITNTECHLILPVLLMDTQQLLISDAKNTSYTLFSEPQEAHTLSIVVQSEDTEARLLGIKSCLLHLLFCSLYLSKFLISFCLLVLIFKGRIIIVYGFQRVVERVKEISI